MPSSNLLRVAIIGFGPRALGALEALALQATERQLAVDVDIYDPHAQPGAGPNFDPEQSDLCILNIPVRILDYVPPAFMTDHIQPFTKWSANRFDQDDFPPRSDVGLYLNKRFQALCDAAPDNLKVTHLQTRICDLRRAEFDWMLFSEAERHGPYQEVLLTQGQPDTAPDKQLARWLAHAAEHDLPIVHAYPANELVATATNWSEKVVAVRGLGLSTLDVLRMLTKGLGGSFSDGAYQPSGREPRKIIPFSLNGKAPVAKPATGQLDDRFEPTNAERQEFLAALDNTSSAKPAVALKVICDALIAPCIRILSEQGSEYGQDDVQVWLELERGEPGSQESGDAVDTLKSDIEMAHGRENPSVGYVVGQVWRKLQGELRSIFNLKRHEIDTAMAIVGFDEGLKRYSYGPPVFAAEELCALIDFGIVSLCTVDDPAIVLNDYGWQLIEGDDAMSAQVMVDAVIPSPSLEDVRDPLVMSLVDAGYMREIEKGMGALIAPDAGLIDQEHEPIRGLSMLGRLTLGSVIAVDGLDDCFGPSTVRWADGVLNRRQE